MAFCIENEELKGGIDNDGCLQDTSACEAALIPDRESENYRNPCAKSVEFLFTKDQRVVSEQGTTLGLALNYYEIVPCYHPQAVVCSTEQVFVRIEDFLLKNQDFLLKNDAFC